MNPGYAVRSFPVVAMCHDFPDFAPRLSGFESGGGYFSLASILLRM